MDHIDTEYIDIESPVRFLLTPETTCYMLKAAFIQEKLHAGLLFYYLPPLHCNYTLVIPLFLKCCFEHINERA